MPAGRPRAFDPDAALDRALAVFWAKGYDGASLPDLTAAMGINRPSLYAAFGNKETLFRRAIERYLAGPAAEVLAAMEEPTAAAVARRWLHGSIAVATGPDGPRGCLLVQSALACGRASEAVRRELCARRAEGEARLRQRLDRAVAEGDLPEGADPAVLARFVTTVAHGLAVQAAGGADRLDLEAVADLALAAWPTRA